MARTPVRVETEARRHRRGLLLGGSFAVALLAVIALGIFWATSTTGGHAPTPPVLAAPSPLPASEEAWGSLFRDASRTSSSPEQGPEGTLRPLWTFESKSALFSPVRSGDAVYVIDGDGYLYALDAVTGAQRWAADTDSRFPVDIREFIAPTVVDDTVFVGTPRATIVAFDAATGAHRWTFQGLGSFFAGVLAVDGIVAGGTSAGMFYAVDADNGDMLWSARVGRIGTSAAATGNGVVVVGTNTGRLHAFDLADGTVKWELETGRGPIRTMPVASGLVYVPTGNGALLVLDLMSGEERWRYDTALSAPVMSPAVSQTAGMLVFTVPGVSVFALDLWQGTLEWRLPYPQLDGGSVSIAGQTLYLAREGDVVALDARTGTERGRFDAESPPVSAVSVTTSALYGIGADDRLYALAATNGEPLANRATPPPTPTVVYEPTIFVGPAGARPTVAPTPAATPDSPRVM